MLINQVRSHVTGSTPSKTVMKEVKNYLYIFKGASRESNPGPPAFQALIVFNNTKRPERKSYL